MKTPTANPSLADVLDRHTAPASLGVAEDERIRCVACGHRCLIGEGKRGICKVRFVEQGQLRAPFGYVAGLQSDPVEKKPFFHVYPSSDALTFGMMGCDLHCSYCFPGDTEVITDRGPISLAEAFAVGARRITTHDAEVSLPDDLRAIAASGKLRKVRGVFKHRYRGSLIEIRPYYLPTLRCTPDHRVYATDDPARAPQPIAADKITTKHFLAIPRRFGFSSVQRVDVAEELAAHRVSYRVAWDLSVAARNAIGAASERGETSREIGARFGKSASYIRHVRSKLRRGRGGDARSSGPLLEGQTVRFPNEHRPGVPATLPLDCDFARLLGFYCAEGCVVSSKNRPNSHTLNFSFSHGEEKLVEEVRLLLRRCVKLKSRRVRRHTTLAVGVSKASAALLFKHLCGGSSTRKHVPRQLFDAPRAVVAAFLEAYCRGDGHRYDNGKMQITTVSRQLAYDIAWLVLKLGHLPSVYDHAMPEFGVIEGRRVNRAAHQYSVVWYADAKVERRVRATNDFHLVPVRNVSIVQHDGDVYNMEVEEEHNYLAGFLLVSNCQNWVTSQALRDAAAAVPVREVTPVSLVEIARREGSRLVVSSYNEPLITAEWAVAVFKEAKAAGLECAFVSNGNATPEVLDFLKPHIIAYKVDLKSFDDRHYRSLGGMLSNITDTIRMIHERGIWLEIVTLVIPGFNDSETELREMARFLASVSRDIPWHVTAFHKDYRMTDPDATPPRTLMRAAEIGAEEGLRYIYAGNLPGQVGPWENTRCPGCGETLIERYGYLIRSYRLTADGSCTRCRTRLPGIWPRSVAEVRTGNSMSDYRRRLPRPLAVVAPSHEGRTRMEPAAAAPSRAELTDAQKQHLVGAAGNLVRALAAGQGAAFADPSLGGLGEHLVAGVFVSLKRGKHLRSCCGMLGQPIALKNALAEAAMRTVWEDTRFPPISPSEVEHLDLEVWLLRDPQPVAAKGEDRLDAVTIGKHGVKVARGGKHGLFLPSVAVDHEWDARRFLDQVCVKAGLYPTAWLDDETALQTFEGEVLRTNLTTGAAPRPIARRTSICGPDDLRAYAAFCCNTIGTLLAGATATPYFAGAPDGNVNGAVITLERAGAAPIHLCQVSLRPGVALQSTLFALCQTAAQVLAEKQAAGETLDGMEVGVTILHDPALHGTVADPHLAGLNPRERAVLVLERNKCGLVYNPAREPAELLAGAAREARVMQARGATVFSLEAVAQGPINLSTAPRPARGQSVRPPGAAGRFFPAEPALLARMVDGLMEGERRAEPWPAAMVPHAGLIYSGQIAAAVLKRLKIPRTVIILGPKHTPLGVEWAVAPHRTWALPGRKIASDPLLARRLAATIPGLEMDAAAHQNEHAIEVELPLIARLAPESRVVGIAIGAGDLESCRRFAAGLASVLKVREDRPLLLISSDMNHFATDAENRRLDALAIAALETLDPATVYDTVMDNHISMCGVLPAVIVLETLRLLGGAGRAERVGYATSADVTGDTSRVVGYAGMLFGA